MITQTELAEIKTARKNKIEADRKFLSDLQNQNTERDAEYYEAGQTMDRVRKLLNIDGEIASDHECLEWAYQLLKNYVEKGN
jgi:hypothetical protein